MNRTENIALKTRINDIVLLQKIFQKLAGLPIESDTFEDKATLSEVYIFKAIEELVELRKTIPSTMNKWAKNQPEMSRQRMKEELSDVILFLVNFTIVWDLTISEILDAVSKVQTVNFQKLNDKLARTMEEQTNG